MFQTIDYTSFSWIIGLSLMIGLSLICIYITEKGFKTFLGFLLIFSGFVVYAEFLDLWVLILLLLFNGIVIYMSIKNRGRE